MKKRVLTGAALVALGGLAVAGLTSCKSDHYLNVRVWNTEFIERFAAFYPDIEKVEKENELYRLKNGTVVRFVQTENKNNAYQIALDEALKAQSKKADNEKVDMFLFEADYALKYVNSDYTLDVKDIGITDEDTKDMYQYTKDIATADGHLKGLSWQATPGLFAYRTDIADEVLGTHDPVAVQALLSDWDKFDAVAAQMKAKNYNMLSGYDDAYRVFSNNISQPLVNSEKKIVIDEQLTKWIEQTKTYTEKGYNKKTSLWDDNWAKEQTINGTTFGFFYSTWGINFTLKGNAETPKSKEDSSNLIGKYRVVEGPASYYWGGTWIAAAKGTDDTELVADIMRKLTCDAAIAEDITRKTEDYTNNKTAMGKLANDANYGSTFLGGQNHIKLFAEAAPKIDMKNISAYDQGINEKLQEAMKDYFAGNASLDQAWENFYTKVLNLYPGLKR